MAGLGHANAVRTEHAAVAVGAVAGAAVLLVWTISGDAQAASNALAPEAVPLALPAAVAAPAAFVGAASLAGAVAPAGPAALAPQPATPPPPPPPAPAPVPAPPVDLSHTPSGWYTPVAHYYFSATFGEAGSWSSGYHTGLDFVTKFGSPVRAAQNGVVVAAGDAGAYGNLIQIRIAPKVQIWYAHNNSMAVKKGDVVTAGQLIGRVGMTGHTSGPHSHFEVRVNDKPKDPAAYLWPAGDIVKKIR